MLKTIILLLLALLLSACSVTPSPDQISQEEKDIMQCEEAGGIPIAFILEDDSEAWECIWHAESGEQFD